MADIGAEEQEPFCGSLQLKVEDFECPVCRDLQYKPVVNACGHVFCFWCIFPTMSFYSESACPMCRQSFSHFSRICELLHRFCAAAFPEEYKTRAQETRAQEEKQGSQAPDLDSVIDASATNGDTSPEGNVRTAELLPSASASSLRSLEKPIQDWTSADFQCKVCNHLVYRPTVLNCGHVVCLSCMKPSASNALRCPICQARQRPGPAGLCVCGQLESLLEGAFSDTYSKRKAEEAKRESANDRATEAGTSEAAASSSRAQPATVKEALQKAREIVLDVRRELAQAGQRDDVRLVIKGLRERWGNYTVHFMVGCDGCGMMPIIGKRFRCQDCPEAMGFDLCGECYALDPPPPGRFNQRHTAAHVLKETWGPLLSYHTILAATPELEMDTVMQWVADAERDSEEENEQTGSEDGSAHGEESDLEDESESEWEEVSQEELEALEAEARNEESEGSEAQGEVCQEESLPRQDTGERS